MSYEEFIDRINQNITVIYEQCEKMTVEEFKEFKNDYGVEFNKMKNPLCEKVMLELFESVENQIFSIN